MKGSIRRRSKNSWELSIDIGVDAQGKRLRKFENVKGTKAVADRRLRELLASLDNGIPLYKERETVSTFMARWLRDQVAQTTKPRTHHFYSMMNRLHIDPIVGHIVVQKLTPADVQAVIAAVLSKGLSSSTARRVYATLHRALVCGVKWGNLVRNVCDAIDAPRDSAFELTPPSRDIVKALIVEASRTLYGVLFHLLAYTGMRRGEVCGLQWEHTDLDKGALSVVWSVGRDRDRKLALVPVKSATSRRLLHIDAGTVDVLRPTCEAHPGSRNGVSNRRGPRLCLLCRHLSEA